MNSDIVLQQIMSSWTRQRVIVIDEFIGFPREIAEIIAGYCMELHLLPWIPREKLDIDCLQSNPNALKAGWFDPQYGHSFWIAANPAAGDIIKANIARYCEESSIWENPSVFELLFGEQYITDDKQWFCSNPHPNAVAMVISGEVEMDPGLFNQNPGAIKWLRAHPELIDPETICGNPAAIDIIRELPVICYRNLCCNSHPWAIEQLRFNQDKIIWMALSANPGIFEYRVDNQLVNVLARE